MKLIVIEVLHPIFFKIADSNNFKINNFLVDHLKMRVGLAVQNTFSCFELPDSNKTGMF